MPAFHLQGPLAYPRALTLVCPVLLWLALLTWVTPSCFALQDLGQGLLYLHIRTLPSDLPGNADMRASEASLVVDLRGTKADSNSAVLLTAWLGFRCRENLPTFLLLNGDTDERLLNATRASTWPALLSLAPASTIRDADVLVDTDPAADRASCERISAGSKIEDLISLRTTKDRRDEAKLAKDYQQGIRPQGRDRSKDDSATATSSVAEVKAGETAPRDLVLARAIHIHRALLALRLK